MNNPELLNGIAATKALDIVDIVGRVASIKKVSAREYAGPCPKCGGTDRLRVNQDRGWFCRQCQGDGHWHDAIDFAMWLYGDRLFQAIERLTGNRILDPVEITRIQQERQDIDSERQQQDAARQAAARERMRLDEPWRVYHENLDTIPGARQLWRDRGLPDDWQNYYRVGYNPGREFTSGDDRFVSHSLTIPYFAPGPRVGENEPSICVGLTHRLLVENAPGGKYRPHMAGLGKSLFLTQPYWHKLQDNVLIVEGEIKAMVTFRAAWAGEDCIMPNLDIVGTAGANMKADLLAQFAHCKQVFICLDPDAKKAASQLAQSLGRERCKVINLPDKIDDLINMGVLDGFGLLELLQ